MRRSCSSRILKGLSTYLSQLYISSRRTLAIIRAFLPVGARGSSPVIGLALAIAQRSFPNAVFDLLLQSILVKCCKKVFQFLLPLLTVDLQAINQPLHTSLLLHRYLFVLFVQTL